MNEEAIYCLALSHIKGINLRQLKLLYEEVGSAKELLTHIPSLKERCENIQPKAISLLSDGVGEALEFAKREAEFCQKKGIQVLCMNDAAYPTRVRECEDAPLILFYRGTANLNASRIVSMVGTRRLSEYGRDLCTMITRELAQLLPDVLIVSGLAYGIDIECHRGALGNGLETVAVLAHGLDRIYPDSHRKDSIAMLGQGGLLTEYPINTIPEKGNFVRRNRIVAAMCDACIVVETPSHGGSMITAGLAFDYSREVFACPGRCTDVKSKGCNQLIGNQSAHIFTSTEDFLEKMGWKSHKEVERQLQNGIQRDLFSNLTSEQQAIADALADSEGKAVDELSRLLNRRVQEVASNLFELELQGLVRLLPGGVYRLIR